MKRTTRLWAKVKGIRMFLKPNADLSILNKNAVMSSESEDSSDLEEQLGCYG